MFHHAATRIAIVLLPLLGLWATRTGAQTLANLARMDSSAFYEGFEGPQVSWREAGGDANYRIESHQRVAGEAHTGNQSEKLVIAANGGTSVYICHDVGQAMLIDELLPTVWVYSDRSGLQFFAEVVLPRTRDPQTGQPISVLIAGTSYSAIGQWQQLRLENLPRALTRRARVLRAELGPNIDEREAYVVRVVLNVYGGPGVTTVWIDDLDLAGYLARPTTLGIAGVAQLAPAPTSVAPNPPLGNPRNENERKPLAVGIASSEAVKPIKVELTGSVLLADGRPIFPRILQYHGEPLPLLSRMGFNAIWLDQAPSKEIIEEANRLSLWLICPPPLAPSIAETDDRAKPIAVAEPLHEVVKPQPEIGPEYRRVLAWNLGRGLFAEQLETTRQLADRVREATRRCNRPLVGQPESDLRSYSRHLNVLLSGRETLGTSLELSDYGTWLRSRALLARPGTPAWTTVQTQLSPAIVAQLQAIDPARASPSLLPASSEQIRLLVSTAIAAGSRGILFESSSPLNADDSETQQRAASLELVNLELAIIEPWIAGGSLTGTLTGNSPTSTPTGNSLTNTLTSNLLTKPLKGNLLAAPPPENSGEITGAMLRSDGARLLLPIWMTPGAQYVPGQAAGNNVTVTAPGVPESSRAYEITPGGLQPLRKNRAMGGMQITLDEFGLVSSVLLTQDPPIVAELTRQAMAAGPRMAELIRYLATSKLQKVQQVSSELSGRMAAPKQAADWIASARRNIQLCNDLFAARRFEESYVSGQRTMRALRLCERAYWDVAVAKLASPVVSPVAVNYTLLPVHMQLIERVASMRPGQNLLEGSEFEDMEATLHAGWQHFEHRVEGATGQVDMVSEAAHRGRYGLRLTVRPEDPKNPPAMLESAPLWITSPAASVHAGDLVCIRGWVRIPTPLTSSVDGLLIFDSLGGESLSERIGRTKQWREFVFYRVVPRDGDLKVTFALCGLGEAHLDDVAIQIMQTAPPRGIGQRLFPFGRQ